MSAIKRTPSAVIGSVWNERIMIVVAKANANTWINHGEVCFFAFISAHELASRNLTVLFSAREF
jgi:hypothetical protein